jgi:hypothetical protein
MGEWEPDDHLDSFGDGSAYFWIVPANVGGRWTFRPAKGGEGFDVELEQAFQKLGGLAGDARVTGSLEGDEISFAFTHAAEDTRITGTVETDRITATLTRGDTSAEYVGTRN